MKQKQGLVGRGQGLVGRALGGGGNCWFSKLIKRTGCQQKQGLVGRGQGLVGRALGGKQFLVF